MNSLLMIVGLAAITLGRAHADGSPKANPAFAFTERIYDATIFGIISILRFFDDQRYFFYLRNCTCTIQMK